MEKEPKTQVLITVDTELSAGLHQRGYSPSENFNSSILGRCPTGDFGIIHQMECLDARGLKGIYFVDPLPALIYGEQIISDIVGPIVERGHDVQLHIHTEWLQWCPNSPVDERTGRNIADFSFTDQCTLLKYAAEILTRSGAARPIAFRAGNYGANDDTLRALYSIGIKWDTSFNPAYLNSGCGISLTADQTSPAIRECVLELPVSTIFDMPAHIRPAQVCALSSAEMRAALRHAILQNQPLFNIVTHSFELLSRDRKRENLSVINRFNSLAEMIVSDPSLTTATFADLDAKALLETEFQPTRLSPGYFRTGRRMVEQVLTTWLYERRLLPV